MRNNNCIKTRIYIFFKTTRYKIESFFNLCGSAPSACKIRKQTDL